jgi:hypothetical protein
MGTLCLNVGRSANRAARAVRIDQRFGSGQRDIYCRAGWVGLTPQTASIGSGLTRAMIIPLAYEYPGPSTTGPITRSLNRLSERSKQSKSAQVIIDPVLFLLIQYFCRISPQRY